MKDFTQKIRVDRRQKAWWVKSLKQLGLERGELSAYVRSAVDRAIAQDFRSQDKKWQKFITAIQPLAIKHLGMGLSDNFRDRTNIMKVVRKRLKRDAKATQGGGE